MDPPALLEHVEAAFGTGWVAVDGGAVVGQEEVVEIAGEGPDVGLDVQADLPDIGEVDLPGDVSQVDPQEVPARLEGQGGRVPDGGVFAAASDLEAGDGGHWEWMLAMKSW